MANRFVAFTLQLLTGNSRTEAGKLRDNLKGIGKEVDSALGPKAQGGARSLDQAIKDIAKDALSAKDAVRQFNQELRTNKSLAQEIANSRRVAANQQALSARIAPRAPVSASGVGQGLQSAGLAGSGLSALLIGIGTTSIQASGSIESVTRAFTQLDQSRSSETLARLKKQADDLKVSFVSYAEQVNKVRATQKLTATESENLVQGLINTARAVGVSRDAQERAVAGLNQLLSKNKIEAEDLKGQIIENIPNLAPIIEKKFGTLDAEILEKKFGAKKFVTGLISELAKLEKLKPTGLERFQAQLENLTTKFAPLGDRILELLNKNIDPLIDRVGKTIDFFTSLDKETQQNIVQFGALAVAAGPVLFAFGSIVQAGAGIAGVTKLIIGMTTATTALSGASGASGLAGVLGGSLNPAVLAVTGAVVAGTVVWYEYKRQINESIGAIDSAALKARRAAGEIEFLNSKEITINTPTVEGLKVTSFGEEKVNISPTSKALQGLRLNAAGKITRKTEAEEAAEETKKALKGTGTGKGGGGAKPKEVTELEQLQKQLKEINKDLTGFQNLTSQEFKLRLELEDKRNLKSELEAIIKLRRSLSEPVAVALPQDLAGVNQEKERLNALSDIKNLPKVDALGLVRESARANAEATAEQVQGLDKLINESLPKAADATVAQALAQNELFQALQKTNPALAEQFTRQAQAADATIRNTNATEQFKSLQEQLNGQLDQFRNLTVEQTTALTLQGDAYKDLNDSQREQLLTLARQVDGQNAFKDQLDASRQETENFANGLRGIFDRLADGPKAFFDNLKSTLKRTLSQMLSDMLTSQALKLLGIVPGGGKGQGAGSSGGSSAGGGVAGTLKNAITGGAGSSFSNPAPTPSGGGVITNLTGGFAGGNPAQQILSGAGERGSLVNSLLSKIPGVGKFLNPGSAAGAIGKIGGLPFADTSNLANLIPLRAPGAGGLSAAGNVIGQGGLLSKIPFLGKAAGFLGKIPFLGGLFGGGGAAAGAGAAGAAGGAAGGIGGLLGGIAPLLTNPVTAIIAGGLLAAPFIAKLFGDRDIKNLRGLIRGEYGVEVKDNSLLTQIKEIGQQRFGKDFKARLAETVRLPEVREIVSTYAENAGLKGNQKLDAAKLGDRFDPRNIIRREFGGPIVPGVPTLVGERRPEVAVFGQSGEIFPSIGEFEKQLVAALQVRAARGGVFNKLLGNIAGQIEGRAASGGRSGGNPPVLDAAIVGVMAEVRDALNQFRPKSANDVLMAADDRVVADGVRRGFNADYGLVNDLAYQVNR